MYHRALWKISRWPAVKALIGWSFAHMSFAIPVKRLRETERWMAFDHPRPSYPIHILLVPKQSIPTLADLDASDGRLLSELIEIVQLLAAELNLAPAGYRLIANGGSYQDFPQLHFHLVSGDAVK